MMITNFIIWNVKPQIVDFGSFELRYYSLLFVVAFILGYIILGKIFRREGLPMEIIALDLRSGLEPLGGIIGETTNEDILDRIFKEFCLGK